MRPIYRDLGAEPELLPYLWPAGPVTWLVLQPIVGATSVRTVCRFGRRMPYLVTGTL